MYHVGYYEENIPKKQKNNYWKIISQLDDRFKVIDYLLNNRTGNFSVGTLKDISENTDLSSGRVYSFLKLLEEKDFIQRHKNGVFRLSNKLLALEENALYESNLNKSALRSKNALSYRCNYDQEWTMKYISDECFSLTGYSSDYFIQNKVSFNTIIAQEYRDSVWRELRNKLNKRLPYYHEYEIITATGQRKWVKEIAQGIGSQETVLTIEGIIVEITDQKEHEIFLKSLREHNLLSGLYDRIYFINLLNSDFKLPISCKAAIVGINLSEINLINDFHYSQKLIRKITKALYSYCTNNCLLFNTYLNRFAFYIKNYKDENELIEFVQEISKTLESLLFNEMVNAGIGIIEITNFIADGEQILKNVLIATENALNNSAQKFSFCFYTTEMEDSKKALS